MFFKKLQDQQPKKPQLLGEDFDIYPDLGDRPKPASPTEAEEASEPEEPDIIEPTDFEKRVAAIGDSTWKKLQIAFGILLGLLCTLCLTVLSRTETFSGVSLILAVVLAILVPNLLEKKGGRKIPQLRLFLIITLALSLGFYLLYGLVINPGFFEKVA